MLAKLIASLLSNPVTIAAAVSPFVMNSINNNRAKLSAKAKLVEEEFRQAHEIADDICSHAERVLHFNKEAAFGIVYRGLNTDSVYKEPSDRQWREYDKYAWEEYQKQILEWNTQTTNRCAQVKVYFGENTYKIFYRILKQMDYVDRMASAAFYNSTHSEFYIDNSSSSEQDAMHVDRDIDSLIQLFRIEEDSQELADLLRKRYADDQLKSDSSSHGNKFTTGLVDKYKPIYDHLKEDDLMILRERMMKAMQQYNIGALRMDQQFVPMGGSPLRDG